MDFPENYLSNVKFEFHRYKTMGDATFDQLSEEDMHWKYAETDNSIAVIVKHLAGNMLSRWTQFLTEDGEKSWRNRESEFVDSLTSKEEILAYWEKGWNCLFTALDGINTSNFDSKIKIRGEAHTIVEAINRQLAHYPNHVGQIAYIGKMIKGNDWISLSIPKGGSDAFNKSMFKSK
ncbi:DUF1572 family protein [Flagellimonas zhangzhouensis]|uniref:DUF1572 domain-containing protein n=1 Tax=Flagellimonas zhangzhouensis TaxID=1073328 RepID=A0A1H2XY30_9FLAO|nr:DUF1572 family protein [Allomuricauda zhangzhouensis]SDQ93101.1 Protein of unknown function [Allomuricauda zhangzhouensis]SDW97787.1 Protein of unknown function [Allomuricauda zhangzhouensis]